MVVVVAVGAGIAVADGDATVDVDVATTIGSTATFTFNAVGEAITLQWTGTSGWALIGHGTGATGDLGTGPVIS